MANTLKKTEGQKYVIEMGDGASPQVYTRIGSINTNVTIASMMNFEEASIPDLDDFDAPYTIERTPVSHDLKVEGSGLIDERYVTDMFDLHMGTRKGEKVSLKLKQVTDAGGFTITCDFYLENFTVNAEYKKASECSQSWVKAGVPTYAKTA